MAALWQNSLAARWQHPRQSDVTRSNAGLFREIFVGNQKDATSYRQHGPPFSTRLFGLFERQCIHHPVRQDKHDDYLPIGKWKGGDQQHCRKRVAVAMEVQPSRIRPDGHWPGAGLRCFPGNFDIQKQMLRRGGSDKWPCPSDIADYTYQSSWRCHTSVWPLERPGRLIRDYPDTSGSPLT